MTRGDLIPVLVAVMIGVRRDVVAPLPVVLGAGARARRLGGYICGLVAAGVVVVVTRLDAPRDVAPRGD